MDLPAGLVALLFIFAVCRWLWLDGQYKRMR